MPPPIPPHQIATTAVGVPTTTVAGGGGVGGNNNLNINLPENNNAILRLEVELRDKNAPRYRRGAGGGRGAGGVGVGGLRGRGGGGVGTGGGGIGAAGVAKRSPITAAVSPLDTHNTTVPLEKVLEELLTKLEIEHVTWTTSKKGYFHHVVFPLQAGDPCETTLHCLTELGIGTKLNSSVSVLPCSVSYDALADAVNKDDYSEETAEDLSKWNAFVESIKSKLTVKQVVDGVRNGGSLSFDYLLLIVTADSLAALGLIENNAPNITAAMLVSPLMGPVMSITFGTIISDRELMRSGFISLVLGMFISLLFGFCFGLIVGTTEMPWGGTDWPTEEMRGRGNSRSLWMGVLWALTSGTGVAVALLQGSAGPLIGVAISASLLPPVVNCGLFWGLACIWLIYPGIRIPHLKGEPLNITSEYPFLYTDYLPTEFLINGIVSCCLTIINVICIFATAIIVLKIKEVSAPYTASPDLKRFWETDLRTVRKTNRSTMRKGKGSMRGGGGGGGGMGGMGLGNAFSGYQGLNEPHNPELDTVLEQALKEAEDDVTFKKVKRMSYSSNAAGELTQRLAKMAGLNKRDNLDATTAAALASVGGGAATATASGGMATTAFGSYPGSRMNSVRRNSKINVDLKALDKLVSNLLQQHTEATASGSGNSNPTAVDAAIANVNRKPSMKLNRWRPTSRSAHSFNITDGAGSTGHLMPTIMEGGGSSGTNASGGGNGGVPVAAGIHQGQHNSWNSSLERNAGTGGGGAAGGAGGGVMRNVLNSIANAPQRFSQSISGVGDAADGANLLANDEENLNVTQNYVA